jgi:hypothetical protein
MTRANPFSTDGSFSTAEKLAVITCDLRRKQAALQKLVDAGRMRRQNFEHDIGVYEALIADLRAQQLRESGPMRPDL